MKFTKLAPLRRYRIFRNFTWTAALPDLARYNVIYGWNGSGKSTLSGIFQAIERGENLDSGECVYAFEGGSIGGAEFSTHKPRPAVRVFNRYYVDNTVFRTGTPGVPPIYFVAEDGADKQARIEEIGMLMRGADGNGGHDAELVSANKAVERAGGDFETFSTDQAVAIKEELRSSGQSPYNNYDKRQFKAKSESLIVLGDQAVEQALITDDATWTVLRQKKNAVQLDRVELAGIPSINVAFLAGLVGRLIGKTVVSSIIAALASNPRAEQWVRAGLTLHGLSPQGARESRCHFCDQPLTDTRVGQLEAHFNDSYQALMAELEHTKGELERAARQLTNTPLPKAQELSEHLRAPYVQARDSLEAVFNDQRRHLAWLEDAIAAKEKGPFVCLALSDFVKEADRGMDNPDPYIGEIRRSVNEHNGGVLTFEQSVANARSAIEDAMVAKVIVAYREKRDAPSPLQERADAVQEQRRLLSEEAAELERAIRQHRVPADELNAELRSYLGRDELQFSVEGSGYSITRAGVRASDLSEGEKTAIAFLYFLKSLRETSFDLATGVVVIDDPVSSLDANSLFCSFAYLSKRTLDAGQLIILTHNFLFLKQVKNWFEFLPKGDTRHYMAETYREPDGRAARLVKLDKLLMDHQSEYHYLFRQVVLGSRMDQGLALESYYGLPNMARRLLEVFLGFRFPAIKGFHKRMEALESDPVAVARIRRFVHTYSHEEGDGEDVDATMLAEAPMILASILDVIRTEDSGHCAQMETLCVAADAAAAA